ncbi:hypothetical protein CABS01_10225 [Colletotrichum abscissum]|uniref:uncharacterized protein n=1 Tax=Colletotrichum abscissum TaxID=1671311 RepID=UPI0027D48479|nr:uncharacterized protein CABS01_10225 [Colletotrichum abscissum]KAK1499827.1 hypothetical protein CABS01_10225 [Colletotrichum abscissum]
MEAAAAVIGLIHPTCKAALKIHEIIKSVKHSQSNLSRLQTRIEALSSCLTLLGDECKERRRAHLLKSEDEHFTCIRNIIENCRTSLETLADRLNKIESKPSGLSRNLRMAWDLAFSRDDVQQASEEISHYTSVLNLSLSTLSLAQTLETKQPHTEIIGRVQYVARRLRVEVEVSQGDTSLPGPGYVAIGGQEINNPNFARTIQQWNRSAVSLAEEVLLEGNQDLRISRPRVHGSIPRGSISSERSDPHEQEPPFNPQLQLYKYKRTVEIVELLRVGELFENATQHLQDAVSIRKLLAEAGKKEFNELEQQDLDEQLADLNIMCETDVGTAKARNILEALNHQCDMQQPIDLGRSSRLHHKLGKLLFDGRYLLGACRHLQTAIELRLQEDPRNRERIMETYELLRHVQGLRGSHAEFLATKDWVEEEIGPVEDSPHHEFDAALFWAHKKGFHEAALDDMNLPKFDVCDSQKRPLLFAAIADGDMEVGVLEQIIQYYQNLELTDSNGDTPLMAAVTAGHVSAVRLLLESGADSDFKDKHGRHILYKCQTEEVAEEIFTATSNRRLSVAAEASRLRRASTARLDISPVQSRASDTSLSSIDINSRDFYGKTALYHACEKGNKDVVSVLLQSFKADTEICGPRKCSPLMAAIQAQFNVRNGGTPGSQAAFIKKKVDIIRMLVAHGADRKVPSSTLRSAGVAHVEIKKILESKVGPQGSTNTLSSIAASASSGVVEEGWQMVARNDARHTG